MANVLHRWWYATVVAAMAVVIAVTLLFHVKQSHGQQTNLGPFETVVSVGNTASMNAVAANPSRRGLVICNGNATAANVITVSFGPSITPTDGVGLIIPGGLVAASCWTAPVIGTGAGPVGGLGAQINMIGHVAGPTSVAVLEF